MEKQQLCFSCCQSSVFLHLLHLFMAQVSIKAKSWAKRLLFFGLQADTKLDHLFKHCFRLCHQKPYGQGAVEFWKLFKVDASVWCSAAFGSAGLEVQLS